VTAVARDAAGNTTTSAPVTVAVSNAFDTSNAGQAVPVGEAYVDESQRQVIRTAANQVYVFGCDDRLTPGVVHVWKGNRTGIPTAFAEVDAAHRPTAGGSAAIVSIDAELDRSGIVRTVYQDNYYQHYLDYQEFSTLTDTWGPVQTIATGLGSESRSKSPSTIVLDANDNPHVVYVTASAVLYTARVGGVWSAPVQLSAEADAIHPVAAFDPAGNLNVAWLGGGPTPAVRYKRRAADGTWGPTETVASSNVLTNNNGDQSPAIVTTASGVPYVLWLGVSSQPSPDPTLPFSAVRVAYRTSTGWVSDNPPTEVYTHGATLYAQGEDVYVFLGHDAAIRYAYLFHLQGQPWSSVIELNTRDSTDGSASTRWDPLRETNAAVIDTVFFDEDVNDDKTFVPLMFYMAVLPGAPSPPSPDTIAPTVVVTAPAGGATVRGTVNVTATAADNVAVAGVQLQLDGANLGPERTAAPYTVAWDTTTATTGAHTLTAIARDAAGNRTTSAPVVVNVDNTTPPTKLVAAYSFDEGAGTTVGDRSGTGNNGTTSSTTWSTAGKYGGALSFNGTSSWVTVPDSASLDLTNAMTLEAWVRPSALATAWRAVLFKEQPKHMVYGLYANTRNGRPATYVFVSNEKSAAGPSTLPLNTWSFLAATYDGSTIRLYVNGAQVAATAVSGAMPASTGVLRLGGDSVGSEWFAGLVDNVRIYGRVLAPAELQADMNTPL
jgi:hypothetical protein